MSPAPRLDRRAPACFAPVRTWLRQVRPDGPLLIGVADERPWAATVGLPVMGLSGSARQSHHALCRVARCRSPPGEWSVNHPRGGQVTTRSLGGALPLAGRGACSVGVAVDA